jgi:CSLREA domain-containing protein
MRTWTKQVAKCKTVAFGLLLVTLVASGLLLAAQPAHASTTFTVTSTGDEADVNLNDSFCDADPSLTVFRCTLRAAIEEANDSEGADTIAFNIPGGGVKTISPASPLPAITGPATIAGYTQPGASPNTRVVGNDAVLMIELNGANAGNSASGLRILDSESTVRGLVINRFKGFGVVIGRPRIVIGEGPTNNRIEGNFIGTDPTGTTDQGGFIGDVLGNGLGGVKIDGVDNNTVGGTTPAARNVVSGSRGQGRGVSIDNGAVGNKVLGNYIGTDKSGTTDLPNANDGVGIIGATDTVVGGTTAGARNVISGNEGSGVEISFGSGTRVLGNFIGTDASGTRGLSNSSGVSLAAASGNTIGGTTPGARNVISANGGNGVSITGGGGNNEVLGNLIGTKKDGTGDLGNARSGVFVDNSGNTIGGATPEAANTIAFNGGGRGFNGDLDLETDGVAIADGATNRILRNSLFSNTNLGIDLGADGVTANDPKDRDTGPNALQNFPVITSVTKSGGTITANGNLKSTPNRTFALQFYSNVPGDEGRLLDVEGKTFLAQRSVTTNANGNAQFSFTFSVAVPVGLTITATATRAGNTSEFSAPREVVRG